jgi:DNA-binding winged helix-turn-helix (wHTH) protein
VIRADLEHAIWGGEIPDSNSLKVHLFDLRKLIDSEFSTQLIHTISGHGFALRES